MKQIVIFYSRADENYFGGKMRYLSVGNTEKIARMIAGIRELICLKLNRKCRMLPIITPA